MDIDRMSLHPRLKIFVVSHQGEPIYANAPYGELDINKIITIGRHTDNDLVLDDPSRIISRVQAQVVAVNAQSANVTNVSASTTLFINAREVAPGETINMVCTDSLMIGAYLLHLSQASSQIENKLVEPIAAQLSSSPSNKTAGYIPEGIDFFSTDTENNFSEFSSLSLFQETEPPINDLLERLLNDGNTDPSALLTKPNAEIALSLNSVVSHDILKTSHELLDEASISSGSLDLNRGLEVEALFTAPRPIKELSQEYESLESVKSVQVSSDVETANSQACRLALAQSLHMDIKNLPAFTPSFFKQLGDVLLQLTEGTVNMMHERAQIKHGMRADVTIIAASGNNPLKFAPDAESAMVHLLGAPMPGFMTAKDAINDAVDDLLAHQIGLLSGARAAVYEVVKNFSPEKIQKYLSHSNLIDSLLPMSKKSKLWELYETHYSEVAGSAREEFELRFQQAFASAYEQEIDRLCEARDLS